MPAVRLDLGKKVESDRMAEVRRIKKDDVVGASSWDVVEELLGQVAVRVDDRESSTLDDVLDDEIAEQRTLAGSRFPDHVEVLEPIALPNTKRPPQGAAGVCLAKRAGGVRSSLENPIQRNAYRRFP